MILLLSRKVTDNSGTRVCLHGATSLHLWQHAASTDIGGQCDSSLMHGAMHTRMVNAISGVIAQADASQAVAALTTALYSPTSLTPATAAKAASVLVALSQSLSEYSDFSNALRLLATIVSSAGNNGNGSGASRRLLASSADPATIQSAYDGARAVLSGASINYLTTPGSYFTPEPKNGFTIGVTRYSSTVGASMSVNDTSLSFSPSVSVAANVNGISTQDFRFIYANPNPITWSTNNEALLSPAVTVEVTNTTGYVLSTDTTSYLMSVTVPFATSDCQNSDTQLCTATCVMWVEGTSSWSATDVVTVSTNNVTGLIQFRSSVMGTITVVPVYTTRSSSSSSSTGSVIVGSSSSSSSTGTTTSSSTTDYSSSSSSNYVCCVVVVTVVAVAMRYVANHYYILCRVQRTPLTVSVRMWLCFYTMCCVQRLLSHLQNSVSTVQWD